MAVSYQLGIGEGVASEQAARVSSQEQQAIDRAEALAQMGVEAQSRLTAMTRRLASLQAQFVPARVRELMTVRRAGVGTA